MIADFESIALRICSALGNGVGQGLLVAGAALLGLRLFHRTSASTRYAAAFATLLTVAALPVVHFILAPRADQPAGSASLPVPDSSFDSTAAEVPLDADDSTAAAASAWSERYAGESPPRSASRDGINSAPPELAAPRNQPSWNLTVVEDWNGAALDSGGESAQPAPRPEISEAAADPTRWISELWRTLSVAVEPFRLALHPGLALGLAGVRLLLAALRMGGLAWQCVVLQRLKHHRLPVPDALRERFASIRREMGIRRPVELGAVADLRSPIAVGFLRPAILLPETLTACPPEDLDPVLRHELAHARRRDDWTNLVQQGIRAVFFFHPGVLALSRRLTLDREIACDDHVLASSRAPRDYALFLTDFASRSNGRQWAAAPAAWSNPNQLRERIHMILDSKRNTSPRVAPVRMGVLTLAALLIAATGIAAAPRLSLEAPDGSDAPTPPTPTPELADINLTVETQPDLEFEVLLAEAEPFAKTLAISTDVDVSEADRPKHKPSRTLESKDSGHTHGSTVTIVSSVDGKPETRREIHRTMIVPDPFALPHPSPAPAAVPMPPRSPRPPKVAAATVSMYSAASGHSEALEERMRRLEKLVDSLVRKRSNPNLPELAQPEVHYRFEGIAKDMELASKDFERAAREAGERFEKFEWKPAPSGAVSNYGSRAPEEAGDRETTAAHRKAVESQRRALRQQIAQMQRQMEQLERQLDRLGDDFEERSEADSEAWSNLRRAEKEVEKVKEKAREKSKDKSPAANAENKPAPQGY